MDRSSNIDKMSVRNSPIDTNTLGAKDLPDIFCDKKHKMKFTYKAINVKSREVFCSLCNDEIDQALGYFKCVPCNEDYCKECAVDRDKPDYEIAENPYVLPTPIQDIMEDSWVGR